jgi:multicomponent Na+:H+ antiporter subunit E
LKSLSFATLIFGLWVLLSGHFEPLLLGLGLASTAFTVMLAMRMKLVDRESHPIHISGRLLRFQGFLAGEIVKANLDVVRHILRSGRAISPQMFEQPVPQHTDLGRVIYANSITLTPGTVSVSLGKDQVLVHALSKEGADDLRTGRLAQAVPDDVEVVDR